MIQARRALRQPVFAASLLFAVILTATGAFGTFRIILPLRLAYWILTTFSAAASLLTASRLLSRYFRSGWVRRAATVVVAAVPTALVAGAAAAFLIPVSFSLRGFAEIYPAALILNLLLLALYRLTARRDVIVNTAPTAAPDDSVPPLIASKLPPRLARGRLLVVEAQDHYLRVTTRDGQALVHMRFADALAALDQSDGIRVHRSWWVARTSIESMKFASGRGELTLVDGSLVPVSRSFAPMVKQIARQPKP